MSKNKTRIVLLSLTLFVVLCSLSTLNDNAIRNYKKALHLFDNGASFDRIMPLLDSASSYDRKFLEPLLLKAEILSLMNDFKGAKRVSNRFAKKNIVQYPMFTYFAGYANLRLGAYQAAIDAFKQIEEHEKIDDYYREQMDLHTRSAKYALNEMLDPVLYTEKKLKKAVNSTKEESRPYLNLQGTSMVFTKMTTTGNNSKDGDDVSLDIYRTVQQASGKWAEAAKIKEVCEDGSNEFGASITEDGRYLFYTTDVEGNYDIYVAALSDGQVSDPKSISNDINTTADEKYPVPFYKDGKLYLIFSSNREGGLGNDDLYIAEMDKDGDWSEPVNMGKNINSEGDESQPFISSQGDLLIYSSNSKVGFGGYDLFYTQRDGDSWTKPRNMGYPINDCTDNFGVWINETKEMLYYTANKRYRGFDIFSAPITEMLFSKYRSQHKALVSITAKIGAHPVPSSRIYVYDYETDELLYSTTMSTKGLHQRKLKVGRAYRILINKTGKKAYKNIYLNYERPVNINIDIEKEKDKDVKLVFFSKKGKELDYAKYSKKLKKNIANKLKKYTIKLKPGQENFKKNLSKIKKYAKKKKTNLVRIIAYPDVQGDSTIARVRALNAHDQLKKLFRRTGVEVSYKYDVTRKSKKFSRIELYLNSNK